MKNRLLKLWCKTQTQINVWANLKNEDGMTTAEYAIGTVAAAAFAGLLLAIMKSGALKEALMSIIKSALKV